MRPWRLNLAAIPVPVDIWYGEHDTRNSPDNGATQSRSVGPAHREESG